MQQNIIREKKIKHIRVERTLSNINVLKQKLNKNNSIKLKKKKKNMHELKLRHVELSDKLVLKIDITKIRKYCS